MLPSSILVTTDGRHVQLATDYRLDTTFEALLVEFYGPVHRTMVGDRQCWHFQFNSTIHQVDNPRCTVKQAVFSVIVKMTKATRIHSASRFTVGFTPWSSMGPAVRLSSVLAPG